jgi:PPOX class probable F420-dependent enzyme
MVDGNETPPSRQLSHEALATLLEERHIAALGTLDPDGRVHVVPLWYRWDRDYILLPTGSQSRKARNIGRRPYASVMIHKAVAGADVQGVLIRGPVEIIGRPQAMELNRAIYLRYISPQGLDQPAVAEALASDDITLRIKMEHIISWDLTNLEFARVLREHNQAYSVE